MGGDSNLGSESERIEREAERIRLEKNEKQESDEEIKERRQIERATYEDE